MTGGRPTLVMRQSVRARSFWRSGYGPRTPSRYPRSAARALTRGSVLIEGYFALLMYRLLYKMHEYALHGFTKVALDTLARILTRRTEPHVKLH